MSDLFGLLFSAALINNLTLTGLVGLDLQVAASRRINVAWLVGLATMYSLTLALPGSYLLDRFVISPLQLHHLDLLFYILLIIFIVFFSRNKLQRLFPLLQQQINAVIPLILMNSFLPAVVLLQNQNMSFFKALFYGLFTGLGFLFLLLVLTCFRERIDNDNIPKPFNRLPVLLIALGIFSMGLTGLAGL